MPPTRMVTEVVSPLVTSTVADTGSWPPATSTCSPSFRPVSRYQPSASVIPLATTSPLALAAVTLIPGTGAPAGVRTKPCTSRSSGSVS